MTIDDDDDRPTLDEIRLKRELFRQGPHGWDLDALLRNTQRALEELGDDGDERRSDDELGLLGVTFCAPSRWRGQRRDIHPSPRALKWALRTLRLLGRLPRDRDSDTPS